MKVLLINGSPHANGCTFTALNIVANELEKNGIETEIVHIGNKDIRGCIACGKCAELGRCVFNDMVNEVAQKFEQADGLVAAPTERSPTCSTACFSVPHSTSG